MTESNVDMQPLLAKRERPSPTKRGMLAGQHVPDYSSDKLFVTRPHVSFRESLRDIDEKTYALRITIESAKDVLMAEKANWARPYCVCEVQGDPPIRLQTQTLQNTTCPMWNHVLHIEDYAACDDIEFCVYNECNRRAHEFLGRATINSEMFLAAGLDIELPLHDREPGLDEAYLKVKVHVNDAASAVASSVQLPGSPVVCALDCANVSAKSAQEFYGPKPSRLAVPEPEGLRRSGIGTGPDSAPPLLQDIAEEVEEC